ncbi:MAG TPA: glycosyltransferase [Candidatus Cloacimonadota bacterium]|nr:glycosyltransferase [Candidatus Cloacimonadota bacterium]
MERVIAELASYFADQQCEVHLAILTKGELFYQLNKKVIVHKPKFIFNQKFRYYHILKTIIFLRKTLNSLKPYSVLSFGETYNSFVLLSALGLKQRIFVSDRSRPDKGWGTFHETLRRILYPKASGIISQTNYSLEFLGKITGHKNIKVIPNPVNTTMIVENVRKNVVLYIGRLVSTKRIDLLLEVFSKSKYKEWVLWIIGDGPERNFLEEQSRNLGVENSVRFWGSQKNIGDFYQQSKIFALTSVSEGFPNALLEAMSYGLGCISFDCLSGPSDLIKDNQNGFLIPILNKDEFLVRLELLQSDEMLLNKLSHNAISTAKQYSISKIGQDYLNFIAS